MYSDTSAAAAAAGMMSLAIQAGGAVGVAGSGTSGAAGGRSTGWNLATMFTDNFANNVIDPNWCLQGGVTALESQGVMTFIGPAAGAGSMCVGTYAPAGSDHQIDVVLASGLDVLDSIGLMAGMSVNDSGQLTCVGAIFKSGGVRLVHIDNDVVTQVAAAAVAFNSGDTITMRFDHVTSTLYAQKNGGDVVSFLGFPIGAGMIGLYCPLNASPVSIGSYAWINYPSFEI